MAHKTDRKENTEHLLQGCLAEAAASHTETQRLIQLAVNGSW